MSIRSNVDARGFDQRIELQRRTAVDDPQGGSVITWVKITDCWAKVDGAPASEAAKSDTTLSLSAYTFWVRADIVKRFNLVMTDRILWGGLPYNIADMPNQQLRGRLAALIARTGANDG